MFSRTLIIFGGTQDEFHVLQTVFEEKAAGAGRGPAGVPDGCRSLRQAATNFRHRLRNDEERNVKKGKICLSESPPLTIEDTEPDRKAGSRGDNRRASRNGRLRGSANECSNRRLLRTVRSSPNRLPAKREKRPSRCRAGEDRTLRHSAAFRAPSGGAKAAAAKTRPLFLRAVWSCRSSLGSWVRRV